MNQLYRTLTPEQLTALGASRSEFAVEVLVGLSETPKTLPSRFFYDEIGSRLFQKICDLEEYYLTRAEHEIFMDHRDEMLDPLKGEPINVVDLGAGDGRKTAILLEHLIDGGADVRYVPIDISESAMAGVVGVMRDRFPSLEIDGLVADYFDGIRWLASQNDRRNVVLFLGSNIGNFNRPRARAFLRRLWNALNPEDRLLIGFDLKKDIDVLLGAYNDRDGTTAAFNLNLLHRINTELGANFDLDAFRHFSTYNVYTGAMESYLISLKAQTVDIESLSHQFSFGAWEPVHTEFSYKFLPADIDALAASTRFKVEGRFTDAADRFCDVLWRVVK